MYQKYISSYHPLTRAERVKKMRLHLLVLVFLIGMLVNIAYATYVYGNLLYELYEFDQKWDTQFLLSYSTLVKLFVFFLGFDIVFIIRIILRIYFIKQWSNMKTDPTVTEARVGFYSFFTLGLFEFLITIWGLVIFFSLSDFFTKYHQTLEKLSITTSAHWAESFTIVLICYGFINMFIYLLKACLLCGLYKYFQT